MRKTLFVLLAVVMGLSFQTVAFIITVWILYGLGLWPLIAAIGFWVSGAGLKNLVLEISETDRIALIRKVTQNNG